MMGTEPRQEETYFLIYLTEKATIYLVSAYRATC